MKPVLMYIQWRDTRGMSYFRLNTSKYTAMPQEKEVLLQDGARFNIIDVIDDYEVIDRFNNTYFITKIHLKYDTNKDLKGKY